ncbi:hypothetical protein [Kamptonema sp. UHCC 0994]|uniref:hypothetical protein n=1 Tax=Kamptonema sp. UHCC 0994 TaxID=3031329 RepID=UPI0023B88A93|nr:hypothetical protein [Kamptonema sp. UHCC 0994]MDF0555308.1 hypothetical protein [Kamptonema sp. UHCC 0994]
MNLPTQELPAILTIYFFSLAGSFQKDPLIDRGGQVAVDVGVVLLAITLVITVKIISPRVEHAILLAIFLSFVLIGLFLIK